MAGQMMLFETDAEQRPDGSFVVKPRRIVDGHEIDAKKAAGMLKFRDVETIYRLIDAGEIKAWKPKSERGNAKYRIDLGSVLEYKALRQKECGF